VNTSSEKEKFISLVNKNRRILYKVVYSYCSDAEDRKDLEQEIIIQLWKSFKNYNEAYKISTWFYKIALNVAISHYRKDLKRKNTNTSLEEEVFQISEDYSAEDQKNKIDQLNSFIAQLDPFNKAIIMLYLDDSSYKDIATALGITETNVGTKMSRIKKQLKEWFMQLND
jgi:RNA polymerase sigma-70 factor (ECF subfamily)